MLRLHGLKAAAKKVHTPSTSLREVLHQGNKSSYAGDEILVSAGGSNLKLCFPNQNMTTNLNLLLELVL